MYRLVAKPFIEKDIVVAIIGYNTYPNGDVTMGIGNKNYKNITIWKFPNESGC